MNVPHVVVTLIQPALDTIRAESLRRTDETETGGILLGHTKTPEAISVLVAGAPGPNAIHERARFLRDLHHAQGLADKAWRDHQAQWIGEWHTHPHGSPQPSEVDLAAYLQHLKDRDLGFTQFLSLIVALPRKGPPLLAAWIVTPQAATPATLSMHGDSPN